MIIKKHHKSGNIIDGDKLRQLREKKGWSLAEMALRCDMTEDNIYRIERNDGNTSTGKLRAMADALNVPPAQLIAGIDELIQEEVDKEKPKPAKVHRDTALLRAFAGDEPAFLQVGNLRSEVPEHLLGEILFLILQDRGVPSL